VVTPANTGEPVSLVNRSGNRPSHEGAAERFDQAIALCREAGFRKVLLRGDTDFSSTRHLDRWDQAGVRFLFGIDAMANLKEMAGELSERSWKRLRRPAKYVVRSAPRSRRENVKEQVVVERGFRNLRLNSEDVAEFAYQPGACRRPYRVVVVRNYAHFRVMRTRGHVVHGGRGWPACLSAHNHRASRKGRDRKRVV